jgi:hypothetical protein
MITNKYYDLNYDAKRNQINWKVKGYWASAQEVPNMELDWTTVLNQAKKPGFNILADLTEMQTPAPDVQKLHAKIQQQILRLGVHKLATLTKSALTRVSVKNIGTTSGINQLTSDFNDTIKAQAWLNEA